MSRPWSPSEAREALRAELHAIAIAPKGDVAFGLALLDAVQPYATACDSAEGFAEWVRRIECGRRRSIAFETEALRELVSSAEARAQ